VFKVKPHPNHHKNLTGLKFTRIQPVPFNSQTDISLSAYLLKANSKSQLLNEQKAKRKNLNVNCAKKSNKEDDKLIEEVKSSSSVEPVNSHSERSNTSHVLQTVRELNLLNNIVSSNYNEKKEIEELNNQQPTNGTTNGSNGVHHYQEEKSLHLADPPPNATIAEWLSANINKTNSTSVEQQSINDKKEESPSKETKEDETKKSESQQLQDQQEGFYNRMKKIIDPAVLKTGWSSDEIEDLTIGELYLMLKKPTKIVLQYDWNAVANEFNNPNYGSPPPSTTMKDNMKNQPNYTTNCSSLISKLITAVSLELMSLNKEKNGSVEIENECLGKNGTKNRKSKKLKTSHCIDDHPIIETNNNENNNHIESPIETNVHQISNELFDKSKAIKTNQQITKELNQNNNQQATNLLIEQFAIPCSPVPKVIHKKPMNNKIRIVSEELLQEARGQLNKFNSSKRTLIRKPTLIKPQHQQFQLNLNTNQLLSGNLCQLIANQAGTALANVPNGQTLISVITQNGSTPVQIPIIDATNTIQINNTTTLNDLCTFVQTNCTTNNSNEVTSTTNGVHNLNDTTATTTVIPTTIVQSIPINNNNDLIEPPLDEGNNNLNQINNKVTNVQSNIVNDNNLTMNMNNMLNDSKTNDKLNNFNDSCLKVLNDDKSVSGFTNLLDISLSDTIFNDSLPFPSDVSIESNFSTKDADDQTLNTPVKIPLQKSTLSHTTGSSFAQFNLFDSSLNNNLINNLNNRTDSFTDGWNLGSDISLNNIFADCTNDKKDDLFSTNFDGVLNASRLNTPTTDNSTQ